MYHIIYLTQKNEIRYRILKNRPTSYYDFNKQDKVILIGQMGKSKKILSYHNMTSEEKRRERVFW